MAREIPINGGTKPLAACMREDVDALAASMQPGGVMTGYGGPSQGLFARLAQEMRDAGAATVGDLGGEAVHRWESELGLLEGPDVSEPAD